MKAIAIKEKERVVLQSKLDEGKSSRERNKLGQFATPPRLALEIVGYGLKLLSKKQPIRFLDPAIGTGAFYSALLQAVPRSRIRKSLGFEIDPHYGKPAQQLWRTLGIDIEIGDFTQENPPNDSTEMFNLVVCNPPYVRHHHLETDEKARLRQLGIASAGIRVGGLAGLYCYFIALSHRWMAQNGIGAWIVPSEFLDVNYGEPIKQYLLNKVTLLRIHRFDPADVQFDDALVTSAVLWFRKSLPPQDHIVEFTYGGTATSPRKSKPIQLRKLQPGDKWSGIPNGSLHNGEVSAFLSDFFEVKRGIATGSNKFFILNDQQIRDLGLPREALRPILPGPRYITTDEIRANEIGDPLVEPKLFVIDCKLSENEVQRGFPSLWKYLQTGRQEVSKRYLCRHRTLWYSQESREPPPYVCTYIGRANAKNTKPFRFILNDSKAVATNVYLMLYPKAQVRDAIDRDRNAKKAVLEILNRISGEVMKQEGRVYGGGMHKLEPRELGKVPAVELSEYLGQTTQQLLF